MSSISRAWHALIVGEQNARKSIASTFDAVSLHHWQARHAGSVEEARYFMQMHACDAVIVDESVTVRDSLCSLRWLTERSQLPVLFLSSMQADLIEQAMAMGAHQWLPREMVTAQPSLLATALEQTLQVRGRTGCSVHVEEHLIESRQQISRLVGMLWELTPSQGRPRWFSQRHVMERLHEEITRNERYGHPFSLILGEIWLESTRNGWIASPFENSVAHAGAPMTALAAERISKCKRGCDVAGQYGMNGFIMLMPDTDREGAENCSRRIQKVIQETPFQPEPSVMIPLRSCVGVASVSSEMISAKSLLRRAEQQLEIARKSA